jgi:methionyl-tRNA formyltransferase
VVPAPPWRIVIFTVVLPAALGLDEAARAAGHQPVAVITSRRWDEHEVARLRSRELVENAPADLDVCIVPEKTRLERLVRAYEPDLCLCGGYQWLLPPEVLAIPRLGVLNGHPSLLPRWRGPFPLAWAVREGDPLLGMTYHLMDESFDTGPILVQGSRPMPDEYDLSVLQPLMAELSRELLPQALERLAQGDRGAPQVNDGQPYAGPFPLEFVELDLARPAAVVHRHVASWRLILRPGPEHGPLTTLDGTRVRVVRTSLVEPEPERGAPVLICADGPLWVLEHEPLELP